MKNVTITVRDSHQTIRFAAEELKKYLSLLNDGVCADITDGSDAAEGYVLGLIGDTCTEADTVSVDVRGTNGRIEGSNPRSVLFAVYQYLEALGVRWVRHGADGEYIPENHDFSADAVSFTHTAKYKHRCMMIEGALSLENTLDNVDWAAKMGFNEYYVQGMLPTVFYKRWYEHHCNPLLPKTYLTSDDLAKIKKDVEAEIIRRDLIYYTVGHGWHSEPFGLHSMIETANEPTEIDPEIRELFAMLGGKRDLYVNSAAMTHLCYSNPSARKAIVDWTVQYCKDNPAMDYIFFPLADGSNNHCECDECKKLPRPSDWYLVLLNELDAELTRQNIPAKIIVTLYCDFLWAPSGGKFNNPERFIYCYAPFHRSIYLYSPQNPKRGTSSGKYKDMGKLFTTDELPPYERNKLKMPETAEDLISFYLSWQEWQEIDAYDHEYYYYLGEHYYDLGSVHLADIIYDDIRELPKYKLTGMLSCQSQRAFMPTGVGSWVMAKALWDDQVPFKTMEKDYFDAAFGPESERFMAHFELLSELSHKKDGVPYDTVIDVCEKMLHTIDTLDLDAMAECHRASIEYARFHCKLVIKQMTAEKASGPAQDIHLAEAEWKDLIVFLRENELAVQPVFDLMQYSYHLGRAGYRGIRDWFNNWD